MIFPCEMCTLKYFNEDDLKAHRAEHIDFQCRCCSKVYSRLCHLRQHIVAKHPTELLARGQDEIFCHICGKQFTRSDHVKRHMATHTAAERANYVARQERQQAEEFFRCLQCGKMFELEMDFLHHDECCKEEAAVVVQPKPDEEDDLIKMENLSDRGAEDRPDNDCFDDDDDDGGGVQDDGEFDGGIVEDLNESCNLITSAEPMVTEPSVETAPPPPRKRGRPRKNPELQSSPTKPTIKVEKGGAESIVNQCSQCDKQFTRACHLKRHMMSHLDVKPYECEVCMKKFSRIDHLNIHRLHHSDVKPHICDICNRGFTRAEHLRKHKQSRHGPPSSHSSVKTEFCTICQKGFTTAKYLLVHMRIHTDRVFACKFCDSKFELKADLNEHMKVHINERPFLCSECGLRFVRNDYLVIHMRRHKGEKPYKCRYCGKGFPRATDLTVHERYHTGEKTHLCTICGKGFQRAYNLLVHMRVHTGERPYQCPHCVKSFAQGNDLKAHVRRHTGERYKCELCGDGFIQGYHLTQHKRNVHGIDMASHIRRVEKVGEMVEEYIDDGSGAGGADHLAMMQQQQQLQQEMLAAVDVVETTTSPLIDNIKLEPYIITVCNDSPSSVRAILF